MCAMPNPPFTVEQVAQLLSCAADTVRERARMGDLPGLKFGSDWVFPTEAFQLRLTEMALDQAKDRRVVPAPKGVSFSRNSDPRRRALPAALRGS